MRGLLLQMIRSRRLRAFFIISVALHIAVAVTLATSPTARDWVFGRDDPRDQPEAAAENVQRAIDTLLRIHRERLAQSAAELVEVRDDLERLQRERLARLKREDDVRQAAIAAGTWPSAERPDRQAVYAPRIDIDPPPLPRSALPALDGLDIAALYALHLPLEREAGRFYERCHALELCESLTEPVPLSRTLASTSLKLAERRALDVAALDPSFRSAIDGRLAAFKQELTAAVLEAQDMVRTAKRWLELAQGRQPDPATSFGQQYNIVPKPTPYFGHYLNPKLLKPVSLEQLIDPPVALGNQIGEAAHAAGAEWMAIDRWHVVGPFTHPGADRRLEDLERAFPPESHVDLDAVYQGKDGRELRWKYRRVGTDFLEGGIRIEPYTVDNGPYAVWYFFAQVVSDRDQQVLASFASDDYGVGWINGERVYQSPPTNQPWVPFTRQGLRVVSLRAGINRILFKLENGLGTTGFSVILMTYEDQELIRLLQVQP